jgi:molybdate transport system substrate-binding protein
MLTHRFSTLSLILGLWLFLGAGCEGSPTERELVVYAASSLTEAFQEMGEAFEADNAGVRLVFNFAGSATLRTQLQEGARADVFASADEQQMELAMEAELVSDNTAAFAFASNALVAAVSTLSDSVRTLADLGSPDVLVVLALPTVPVGAYTREWLRRMDDLAEYGPDFSSRVLANVVSEETNVRGVLAKVSLGEADAGIVYATDVAARSDDRVRAIPIPSGMSVVAVYPVALLRESREPELAQAFVNYLLSPEGQAVLQAHGFGPASLQGAGR